jgi:hypothetical protein
LLQIYDKHAENGELKGDKINIAIKEAMTECGLPDEQRITINIPSTTIVSLQNFTNLIKAAIK